MKIRKPRKKLAKRLQRSVYAWGGVEKDLTDNYDYQARWNETFWGATAAGTASGAALGATVGGPWGAAIGGTVGTIAGAISGAVMGDDNAEKQEEMFAQAQQQRKDRRSEIETKLLEDFPSQGIEGASYNVAYGGNIKPNNMKKRLYYQQGGQMTMAGQSPQGGFQQLASNVQEVQGASHEQGGVPLSRNAEVEGGEVVSNQMDGSKNIFSDRLEFSKGVTFADKAAELGKKKSKFEEKMNSGSIYAKGSARRQIDKIEGELQRLFATQEQMKQVMGIPSPEEQAAMEQQAMMQQQGMPQQGMEQGVEQQMAQQMGQQTQFKMGGKYVYENGGKTPPSEINQEEAFVKEYYPIVKKEIEKLGLFIDARALTSQLYHESRRGKGLSGLATKYNNFGGYKAIEGLPQTPPLQTKEYFTEDYAKEWAKKEGNTIIGLASDKTKGKGKDKKLHYLVKTPFSHFKTKEEGIAKQVELVARDRYAKHGTTNSVGNPQKYFEAVKKGGYATSIDYVDHNMDTFNRLKQYFPSTVAKVNPITDASLMEKRVGKFNSAQNMLNAAQNIPAMQGDNTVTQPIRPFSMATGGKLNYYHGGYHPPIDYDYDPNFSQYTTIGDGSGNYNFTGNNKTGGGGMSQGASQAIGMGTNLLGDVGNLLLTQGMAETPTPETYYAMPLPTTVSTAATEYDMKKAARDANKLHLQNTASAQSAKANMAQTTAMGQAQLNKVHQDRINQENKLKTANRLNQQQVSMMNTQAQAAYKQQNLIKEGTKRSELSAILNSATGKINMGMAERNQMNKDLFEVQLLEKQYKDNGVWDRNIQKLFSDYRKGIINREALNTGLANTTIN